MWLPLLDQLVPEVGKKGYHSLVAETAESGEELTLLRRAGFAIYTREDLWLCRRPEGSQGLGPMRRRVPADDWDIQVLYANLVPRLIQLVEPNPPLHDGENLVLREDGEIVALIHIKSGQRASLMRAFIHPNARTGPREMVMAALAAAGGEETRPVYCAVSRNQSWLQSSLAATGFEWWGSQAMMVKHITQSAARPAVVAPARLDHKVVQPSSPLVHGLSERNGRSHVPR
jgi:hypothetical protein